MVAWADVPDGALVREVDGVNAGMYTVRHGELGLVVSPHDRRRAWAVFRPADAWGWEYATGDGEVTQATIIALGLTGEETADELRRLAEAFEVQRPTPEG